MQLDHIVLLLGDLEASLPYYETLLPLIGFAKTRDHVWGNSDGVYLHLKQAGEVGEGYRRHGVGLNHLGFTAPTRAALDEVAAKMAAAGFEVPAVQDFGDAQALFMKDRDGIRFEITYYPPR
jgi:catechol-2,3-dioxygenase